MISYYITIIADFGVHNAVYEPAGLRAENYTISSNNILNAQNKAINNFTKEIKKGFTYKSNKDEFILSKIISVNTSLIR